MGRLYEEHMGWTREDLDEMFGPDPLHASAPTRAQLETEREEPAELDDLSFMDDLEEDEDPAEWTCLSDEEIRTAVRRICRSSRSDQEVEDRLRDELGYPFGDAAVTSTSDGCSRMTMVMLHGPRGNTISV